jgi:hypothetical protein
VPSRDVVTAPDAGDGRWKLGFWTIIRKNPVDENSPSPRGRIQLVETLALTLTLSPRRGWTIDALAIIHHLVCDVRLSDRHQCPIRSSQNSSDTSLFLNRSGPRGVAALASNNFSLESFSPCPSSPRRGRAIPASADSVIQLESFSPSPRPSSPRRGVGAIPASRIQ